MSGVLVPHYTKSNKYHSLQIYSSSVVEPLEWKALGGKKQDGHILLNSKKRNLDEKTDAKKDAKYAFLIK
jgi:hypothetical protein